MVYTSLPTGGLFASLLPALTETPTHCQAGRGLPGAPRCGSARFRRVTARRGLRVQPAEGNMQDNPMSGLLQFLARLTNLVGVRNASAAGVSNSFALANRLQVRQGWPRP